MKTTINGITFNLTTRIHNAPMDTNGNKRVDVEILVNGKPLRDSIKGYRLVKNGYRVQLGSHNYSEQQAQKDVTNAFIKSLEKSNKTEPSITSNGTKRSTHSSVIEKIQTHVIECLSEDETTILKEQLENVLNAFKNYYGTYEKKAIPNIQQAFVYWLNGLPSELSIEPYYYNQKELLIEWLGKPTKEYDDEKVNQSYMYLVYREFNRLCRNNGLKDIVKGI